MSLAERQTDAAERIWDADFHNTVDVDALLEYIDDEAVRTKVSEFGVPQQPSTWNPNYARKVTDGFNALGTAHTTADVQEAMRSLDVDCVVLNPNLGATLSDAQWDVIKTEIVRAYNDLLVEELVAPSKGVLGTALVPQWDPDAAAEEVQRIGDESGIVGMQGFYTGEVRFGEPKFDAFFQALVDAELPLVLHGGGYSLIDRQQTYNEAVTFEWTSMAIVNLLNMIFSGVFDVYDDLTVVVQEAGVNWIPFVANRADEMYQTGPDDVQFTRRLFAHGQTYLDRLPSKYLTDDVYYTTQPIALPENPAHAEAMFEMCNAEETLIFSSDWPHSTTDLPTWVYEHPKVDENLRAAILYENAETAFDI